MENLKDILEYRNRMEDAAIEAQAGQQKYIDDAAKAMRLHRKIYEVIGVRRLVQPGYAVGIKWNYSDLTFYFNKEEQLCVSFDPINVSHARVPANVVVYEDVCDVRLLSEWIELNLKRALKFQSVLYWDHGNTKPKSSIQKLTKDGLWEKDDEPFEPTEAV